VDEDLPAIGRKVLRQREEDTTQSGTHGEMLKLSGAAAAK